MSYGLFHLYFETWTSLIVFMKVSCIWARPWENVSYIICEQQRPRSACASAQSDQCLCFSLPRQNDTSSLYIRNFKILAGFCSWAGQFVSCLVGDSRRQILSWRVLYMFLILIDSPVYKQCRPWSDVTMYPGLYMRRNAELNRLMTKPSKWLCVQRRLRSTCAFAQSRSVRVAERLALPTSDHGVAGSNPAGGEILPEPKRRFIAQSFSCSPFHPSRNDWNTVEGT